MKEEAMSETIHRGSCLCGAVRYEVRGALRDVVVCHCSMCRKQTGHYLAASSTRAEHLKIIGEDALRWYRSSAQAERGFCGTCGSALFWRPQGGSGISVTPGTLDGPTGLRIEGHIFCADKGDYYEVPEEGYRRPGWS
jgi:hypothetical protein